MSAALSGDEPMLADQLFALADTFTAMAVGRLVMSPVDAEINARLLREASVFARRMQVTLDEMVSDQQEQALVERFNHVRNAQISSGTVTDLAAARALRIFTLNSKFAP